MSISCSRANWATACGSQTSPEPVAAAGGCRVATIDGSRGRGTRAARCARPSDTQRALAPPCPTISVRTGASLERCRRHGSRADSLAAAQELYADFERRRMRHRTVIAVGFLDGAAVVPRCSSACSHSRRTAPRQSRTAVAQASPSSVAAAQVLAEEARTRQANEAERQGNKLREANARETHQLEARASRLRERHAREAKRASAKSSRAQEVAARRAAARAGTTERGAGSTAPQPKHEAAAKTERADLGLQAQAQLELAGTGRIQASAQP